MLLAAAANCLEDLNWKSWVSTHGKKYDSPAEEKLRQKIFRDNQLRIQVQHFLN
jgi:hypothetical protein